MHGQTTGPKRERRRDVARIMDIRGICIASVVLQTVIFGSGSAFT